MAPLIDYVARRGAWLDEIMEWNLRGLGDAKARRERAKTLVTAILNGGGVRKWLASEATSHAHDVPPCVHELARCVASRRVGARRTDGVATRAAVVCAHTHARWLAARAHSVCACVHVRVRVCGVVCARAHVMRRALGVGSSDNMWRAPWSRCVVRRGRARRFVLWRRRAVWCAALRPLTVHDRSISCRRLCTSTHRNSFLLQLRPARYLQSTSAFPERFAMLR